MDLKLSIDEIVKKLASPNALIYIAVVMAGLIFILGALFGLIMGVVLGIVFSP